MPDQSSLFRKVSLDRLSSPEQLDQKITVISPIGWTAIVSLAILILAAVAWGFLGIVSNKVNGSGILMYGDGIVSITSQTSGQITDISVQSGDYIEKGQIIAHVTQDDLERQIEEVQKNIAALETVNPETLDLDIDALSNDVYSQFASLLGQIRSARAQYETQRLEAEKNEKDISNQKQRQAQQISALERQIDALEKQIPQYKSLAQYQYKVELENAAAIDRQQDSQQIQVDASLKQLEAELEKAQQALKDGEFLLDLGELSENQLDVLKNDVSGLLLQIESRRLDIHADEPKSSVQVENRPSYDATLTTMQSQLDNYRLELIQAQTNDLLLDDTFAGYLWGAYNQTGEQISSLMEQFSDLKQVMRQDYLDHLQELQTQYAKKSVISAEFNGIVSGLSVALYDFVQPGFVIGNIVRGDQAAHCSNVTLYVPMDKGKLVEAGMEVNISPTTVNREEYGYIIGQVVSVSASYVTQEHMMATLQNQQLVSAFSAGSAVLEVELDLFHDNSTVSGYRWSTPKGAPFAISPGTICGGEIKVSDRRPIDMVVPFIKRLFQ